MKKILFFLMFFVTPVFGATVPTDTVILQGMDKVTGRVKELSFPVGASIDFGELTIFVDKCLTKTPEETPENAAFLRIYQNEEALYSGWMFSSNPAISAMEDPVYDIWVVACRSEAVLPSETEQVQIPELIQEYLPEISDMEIED